MEYQHAPIMTQPKQGYYATQGAPIYLGGNPRPQNSDYRYYDKGVPLRRNTQNPPGVIIVVGPVTYVETVGINLSSKIETEREITTLIRKIITGGTTQIILPTITTITIMSVQVGLGAIEFSSPVQCDQRSGNLPLVQAGL